MDELVYVMANDTTRASLDLLYHVSRDLASALELRTVLQRVLFQSLKYIEGERGSIVVIDDNGKAIDAAIVYGMKLHDHTTQQLRDTVERGLAGWVIRNQQPAWVPDTSRDNRWLRRPDDATERSGSKAAMCVPLTAREHVVGVLTLVHSRPGAFTREHFDLMQAIADQAGIAVLNARLYTESQRQARVMTALASGAAAINTSLEMENVLEQIMQEVIQALQVETVALALIDSKEDLAFRAAAGMNTDSIVGHRVPNGVGLIGWVAQQGEGVVIPVVSEDERIHAAVDQFDGVDMQAIACAPIFAQGRVIGVLEAINPVEGTFDPDALLVLAGIGNLAGSNLQHAQLFERLQAAHIRYRELFDDSIDPILLTNWEGIISEMNRQATLISGFSPNQLKGMNIDALHTVDWSDDGACRPSLKRGETCQYESVLKTKTGIEIPIQVYVRRVRFEEADLLQWILRDITERKNLDTLREDLMAMIYHDLRSPLANIVSSLDVLTTMVLEKDDETVKSVLTIAHRSTERIQRLISSLLDISRLEAGQPVGEKQTLRLESLFKDAVDAVLPMADSRQQTIETHLPKKPLSLSVDSDMTRRVLINLLENALKFSPPESKIEVKAKKDRNWIRISVKDNGPGFRIQDQERIFDKFTRLPSAGSPSGLGIGLAFCRLAVQGHGGRIWAESQPDEGATFIFTLPSSEEKA